MLASSMRRVGLASHRRWAVRSLCAPAAPTFTERLEQAANSAPSKAFDAVRKRGGSLGDSIAAMREKKRAADKDDAFAENTQTLIKLPKFTMAEFRDMLQASLDKQEAGMTFLNTVKVPPWQRPSSASPLAVPQLGSLLGSAHWAPSHCLGCPS